MHTVFGIIKWGVLLYIVFALIGSTVPWLPFLKGRLDDGAAEAAEAPTFSCDCDTPGPDRAMLVEDPNEAFAVRIAMVRGARETLDIVYYTIQGDASGEAFLGEVLRAADRGVQVRILLDGTINMAGGVRKSLAALQTHPNVDCRLYNPPNLLRPWQWHALLHDKMILVDETHLLSGGRNVGDRFFDLHGYEGAVTHDRDAFVTGACEACSVTLSAKAHIDDLWTQSSTRPQKAAKDPQPQLDVLQQSADRIEAENPACYTKDLDAYIAGTWPTQKITMITNPIHTGKKVPVVGKALEQLAREAERSVIIQTPYSTANRVVLNALTAVDAGAETIMLTNSLASTPNIIAFSNYYSARKEYLATGIDIYELQSTDSMHGKSMVIDNHLSVVGSLNLDDRSLYIDTENVLVIDSEPFAAALRQSMTAYEQASLQVGMDGAYLDGDVTALHATTGKRVIIAVVSVFSRLFQFLI